MAANHNSSSSPSMTSAKQVIGNAVRMAQDYESSKKEREAYQYYLYAVQHIVSQLQHVSPQGGSNCGVPHDKLFALASNCLESARTLMEDAAKDKREFTSVLQQSVPVSSSPGVLSKSSTISGYAGQKYTRAVSDVSNDQSVPIRHNTMAAVSTEASFRRKPQVRKNSRQATVCSGSPPQKPVSQTDGNIQSIHRLSQMDKANHKNVFLMQQYKASLRRDSARMLGSDDSRQNLTLNYLRRMEENKSVARINEQIIARKGKERAARLRQESQKVKMSHQFRKSMDSLSIDDLNLEVVSFEHGKSNFHSARHKLSNTPDSPNLVNELITEVLSCCDHPMSKLLGECQFSVTQFLQPAVKKIESVGRLPYCTFTQDSSGDRLYATSTVVSSEETVSSNNSNCRGSHDLHTDASDDTYTPSNETNGNNGCGQESSEKSGSLDRRLEMLKAELTKTTVSTNGDSDRPDCTTRSSSDGYYNGTKADHEEDEEFITLRSPMESHSDMLSNGGDDDEDDFQTLAEVLDTLSSPEGEDKDKISELQDPVEQRIVFKGLVRCDCKIHWGDEAAFKKLNKEYSGIYLDGAVKLIRSGITKMVSSFTAIYPEIAHEDNTDECRNVIEAMFFPPVLPLLLPVYRISKYSTECKILRNMVDHYNETPKESGVRRKFWLENQDKPPYMNSISILQELCRSQTPHGKLNHLVTFSKSIIQSIEEYYSSSETKVDTGVGVDDILPIMTYIIIKSARPELISECSFMQDFIQEGYSMGEEGFCLTSFDTAVRFVTQMDS